MAKLANGRWSNVTRLPNNDWHPEEIKAAVRMRDSTLYALARRADLPEHACRNALTRPHFEGECVIAEFLGVKPQEIWPSRYHPDGGRIPGVRRRVNARADPVSRHRQIAPAA